MKVALNVKGDLDKTKQFFKKTADNEWIQEKLEEMGRLGVEALASFTPVDTGRTAESWSYEVFDEGHGTAKIVWTNDNMTLQHQPIAILLQYGHGTNHGGYVPPIDYINPAMGPVFEQIAEEIWDEVINS